MRITDPIKAYQNQSFNQTTGPSRLPDNQGANKTAGVSTKASQPVDKLSIRNDSSLKEPNNLITRQERDFFIKMFPENSDKLEKHVLFNRNGRLQTSNVQVGSIVDQKV